MDTTGRQRTYQNLQILNFRISFNVTRGNTCDNPVIDTLNGWINEELFLDFNLSIVEDVSTLLNDYVKYFNYERHAAAKRAVQYKTELGL